ncbi:MAG: plastocyanin/azurin family copper-binding protein [Gemmatimonadales bacterium]
MKRVLLVSAAALALGAGSLTAQASKAPAAHSAGRTVRVQMLQQGSAYKFVPANFSVHPGDVVEFVNVSGFPHNVGFEANQIPAGAAAVLNAAMARRSGSLLGPMMMAVNETYRISFAGAPVGAYHYFCLPHKALGMVGVITVAR